MEAIRLLDKATEPTTIGETSTPGLWNKCGSAIKITLLVVGLLLGAAAALSFFYASGATSPSILTGCALAAIVGAVITHLVQGRTCITDAPQVANTEPPPIETTDTEGQPPPEKLPTASLLFEANVIRKLDRSETSGIVLKKDNQADWHALDELNAAQKKKYRPILSLLN